MADIESDGRLRRLVERYFTAKNLRKRRQQIAKKLAAEREKAETAEVVLRLDDLASITGLPKSHPDVLVLAAKSLAADDRRARQVEEVEGDDFHDDEPPYTSSFGSDW